ncbi:MAG: (Na+)-NQR maturation NqrM [Panacagrimonas sp.]
MLSTLLVTFVAFALAFFGLAIGWLVAEKRLKGSCGGLNGGGCSVCDKPCESRRKQLQQQ